MTLQLAFSSCPNDCYIFYAWSHHLLPKAPIIECVHQDVQKLNDSCKKALYPICKISIGQLPYILDHYLLLPVGGALSNYLGPKVVSDRVLQSNEYSSCSIAIPGKKTTAHFLFDHLFGPIRTKKFCKFDQVSQHIHTKKTDLGILIHEERFHLKEKNLIEIADLGKMWFERHQLPLPLGGIVIRKDIAKQQGKKIVQAIQDSLLYVKKYPLACKEYVLSKCQEKDWESAQKHIDLYVNEETLELSEKGKQSIEKMLHVMGVRKSREEWLFSI